MSESPIAEYLDQLDCELRINRAPRTRLLAEAADHLEASAEDVAALCIGRREAERQAVARFGEAAAVARRFAHAVASTSARTSLVCAVTACAGYAVAAAFFILTAPSWLRDFPQGAPSMVALQVAVVALVLSGIRALHFRKALLIDEVRLRLIGNGVVIATGAVVAGAALELLLALMRPAPAPWSGAAAVIGVFAVAAVAALIATFVAVAMLARTRALAALPQRSGDEPPVVVRSLVDDVAEVAPSVRPLAAVATSHPVLACTATAALAFVLTGIVDAWGSDLSHASALGGAAATGLFEAVAVVAAYLALGRALGLRARRYRPAG